LTNKIFLVFFLSTFLDSAVSIAQFSQTTLYPVDEHASLNAIIPDFQVNENEGGGPQSRPAVTTDANGNFVVTWLDRRNGDNYRGTGIADIYAQRYASDGTAIGSNFRVNDEPGSAEAVSGPAIASDSSGNFVITWEDDRDFNDIYAQRYTSDGVALGSNFKVNDELGVTTFTGRHHWPDIAMDGSGNYVITWSDGRRDGYNIFAQRYSSDDIALGSNFKVSDAGDARQFHSAIAIDESGTFMITWHDERNDDTDIYAQLYASDGSASGNNLLVSDDPDSADQGLPDISTDGNGNFVITWQDGRNGDRDIFAQLYASDGSASGNNFLVSDDPDSAEQRYPAISTDSNGNFVVTWQDERDDDDIYAQRYDSDGMALGNNFKVNDDQGDAGQYRPAIAADRNGDFLITWEDERHGDVNIYVQRHASNGNTLGNNLKVNDDEGSARQAESAISTDGSGNFVITWEDLRSGDRDIYAQRYSRDGTALGTNFKVNVDPGSEAPREAPVVATDSIGNFVITWQDLRSGIRRDIYAQRYSSDGTALGSNIKVNNDEGNTSHMSSAIAMEGSGDFVIAWVNYSPDRDIYAQRYKDDGTAIGNNFKVNDVPVTKWVPRLAIAIDSSGSFIIAWEVEHDHDGEISAQRYSSDGTALVSNFRVDEAGGFSPAISADAEGNFVIAWQHSDIFAQRYSGEGTAIGGYFRVNDEQASCGHDDPAISTDDNGNFVITWSKLVRDERGRCIADIYGQRYASDGTTLGENFKVIHTTNNVLSHDVQLWNNRIYNTWTDNPISGTGYDIWANVLEWDTPVGIDAYESTRLPLAFALHQNHPNPFNTSTIISYSLPKASFVVLKIYNIHGRGIQTLVDEYQTADVYTVQFDASDLASGLYFYKLFVGSDFVETKKMVLMK